ADVIDCFDVIRNAAENTPMNRKVLLEVPNAQQRLSRLRHECNGPLGVLKPVLMGSRTVCTRWFACSIWARKNIRPEDAEGSAPCRQLPAAGLSRQCRRSNQVAEPIEAALRYMDVLDCGTHPSPVPFRRSFPHT